MSSGEKDGAGKDKGDKEKKESWLRSGAEKPLVLGPETEAMTALGQSLGLEGEALAVLIAQGARSDFNRQQELERRKEEMKREEERRREEMKREEERRREDKEREEARWRYLFERDEARWEKERAEKAEEREKNRDASSASFKVKIEPFNEKEDIDLYLRYFERIAATHGWNDHIMALRILPLLQGIGQETVMQMPEEEVSEYRKIRDTLLFRFKKTAEHFRKKFRDTKKEPGETFVQCGKRMRSYVERWFTLLKKDIGNVDDVLDVFLQEASFKLLFPEMEIRVREQRPSTYIKLLEHADIFAEARSAARPVRSQNQDEGEKKLEQTEGEKDNVNNGEKCYSCGGQHKRGECPSPKVKVRVVKVKEAEPSVRLKEESSGNRQAKTEIGADSFSPTMDAVLNGQSVVALRDTGSDTVLVDSRLVKDQRRTGRTVTVCSVDPGWEREAETAIVDVRSPWLNGEVEAVVLERSTQELIIGNQVTFKGGKKVRVPLLPVYPEAAGKDFISDGKGNPAVLADETRSQIKKDFPGKYPRGLKERISRSPSQKKRKPTRISQNGCLGSSSENPATQYARRMPHPSLKDSVRTSYMEMERRSTGPPVRSNELIRNSTPGYSLSAYTIPI